MRLRTLAVLTILTLALPWLAAAQEEAAMPITWVAFNHTQPGKAEELVAATVKHDAAMYDGLLADGTLLSWGIVIPITHNLDDDWNYALWATLSGWSQVGDLQAGFEKLFASRSPEEMEKLDQQYRETVVPGAHHDWVVRHLVQPAGSAPEGTPPPRYFVNSTWKAKPGQEQAVAGLYREAVAPVLARLLAEGVVNGYGLYGQELHSDPDWTYISYLLIHDLGAIDRVHQALDAAMGPEAQARAAEIMEMEAHRDQVLLIVHLGGTGSGDGDEGES